MTKLYYRNEYTDREWRSLIDRATGWNCTIIYGKYGNNAVIDSTALETAILTRRGCNLTDSATRELWAEHIHQYIQTGK